MSLDSRPLDMNFKLETRVIVLFHFNCDEMMNDVVLANFSYFLINK